MSLKTSTLNRLDDLFSQSSIRHYKKGHILIFSDDTTEYFYNLVSGRIKVYDVNYRGDEVIINKFGPPTYFPMSLVINASKKTDYIYEADEDIEIKAIKKGEVLIFLHSHPQVVMDLFSNLYHVLDEVISRYVLAATKNAKARLIFSIISECKKFAITDDNGIYLLKISESELAAISSLSRETVSREMTVLKREQLLSSGRRSIQVGSMRNLEEYLRTHI
ncbi:MAG: hypothetical protein JWN26_834 [Candidatus Saccharibacteria bacterium]|nr:hypothetical protein [Candidatus Saccharibacteria bacterium]